MSITKPSTGSDLSRSKILIYGSAIFVRLLLAILFPDLPDFLTERVEISTPITSFKRLKEGLFLHSHGVSAYDGGILHQSPLLLSFFSISPKLISSTIISVLLYTMLDIICAELLMKIASSGVASSTLSFTSPRKNEKWKPITIAMFYLFNPFTIFTCLGRPTSVFSNLFILLSIAKASSGSAITCSLALALATYTSLHPILLLPAIIMLCHDRIKLKEIGKIQKNTSFIRFTIRFTLSLTSFCTMLLGLSYIYLDDWSFLSSVYGTRLLLPDLTPNIGLWWYFFIEMFDSFRSFFLGVFWLHMTSYSFPLAIRFNSQPLAAIVMMCGVFAIFQPYANVGDAGLFLSMLGLYGHVFDLTRYLLPAFSTILYTSLLGPAFYYLWIYAGSGNANFFYAITLVWSLGLIVLQTDVLYAILRDELEMKRPGVKGKDVKQI